MYGVAVVELHGGVLPQTVLGVTPKQLAVVDIALPAGNTFANW
jgi:hypothetical protein